MSKIRFFEGAGRKAPLIPPEGGRRSSTKKVQRIGYGTFPSFGGGRGGLILVITMALSLTAAAQSRDSVTVKNEIAALEQDSILKNAHIGQMEQDSVLKTAEIENLENDIANLKTKIEELRADSINLIHRIRVTALDSANHVPLHLEHILPTACDSVNMSRKDIYDTARMFMAAVEYLQDYFSKPLPWYLNPETMQNLHDVCEDFLYLCDTTMPNECNKLDASIKKMEAVKDELDLLLQNLNETRQDLEFVGQELEKLRKELEEIRKNAGVGIEQLTIDNGQLKIYPNPAGNQLQITNYELRENAYIEIYSIVGQLVQTSPNPSKRGEHTTPNFLEGEKAPSPLERAGGEVIIDISHLASGIYFLKIGNQVTKFVKE